MPQIYLQNFRDRTLAGLVGTVALIHGQTRTVDFEQDALGQAPEGFKLGHTAKIGAPGRWLVQAEGNNKYLAQLDADATRLRFPVAVLTGRHRGERGPLGVV